MSAIEMLIVLKLPIPAANLVLLMTAENVVLNVSLTIFLVMCIKFTSKLSTLF